MRKLFITSVIAGFFMSVVATSCGSGSGDKSQVDSLALINATREELQQAVSERDQLLDMMNQVQNTMDEINRIENIVSITPPGEVSTVSNLNANLEALRATLEDRRKKLDELEAKLKESSTTNQNLMQTVATLRSQLEMQGQQIEMLTNQLADANRQIEDLNNTVAGLNEQVTEVTDQRDQAIEEAKRQEDINNECFVAIGTKKELQDHNIVESGFLKKTKIMQGEFDMSFFQMADKRTLRSVPLYSKKAKVVTTYQPKDSYQIVDDNGMKVLKILNPAEFWGISNYLVIQVD